MKHSCEGTCSCYDAGYSAGLAVTSNFITDEKGCRYCGVYFEKINQDKDRFEAALNEIGMLLHSEHEHSKDLPNMIAMIIKNVLKIKPKRWPY